MTEIVTAANRTPRGHQVDVTMYGTVGYAEGLAFQEELVNSVRYGSADQLVLLEHPPTFTFGRSARESDLRLTSQELNQRGATLMQSSRGGATTFHGPGQMVGYSIMDLYRRGM